MGPASIEDGARKRGKAPCASTPGALIAVVAGVALLAFVMMFGIIAAIAIPNLLNAIDRGKQKRTLADLRAIGTAIEAYREDEGALPIATDIATLESRLVPTYITNLPKADGWGRTISVEIGEDGYLLASAGKDGVSDGCVPGVTDSFDDDICFAGGEFVRYPRGVQR